MNEKSMQKERLHWVDAAKGILIVLVAMVHVIGRGDELGIACPAIGVIGVIGGILCFRMPAFFILAGFWGKYDMSFKDFLLRNAKGLLLPLIVFSYLGGVLHEAFYEILKGSYNSGALEWPFLDLSLDYWFVLALFIAKCVYWFVCRISSKQIVRFLICVGIYALGVLSLKAWFLPNFACWKWALIMLVYLPVGQWVKDHLNNWIRVLELIGRNTLAIYVMHWWIEILAMKVLRSFFGQGVWMSTTVTIVTILAAVFIPCLISELLNRPKLKWILGK